ncbi:hypothetical protein ERO13_D05G317201v2 [Gossypium hirsutum]|nr:hypothetical protein ERO13_D05G317201v2 [Gossypium hirsutum]
MDSSFFFERFHDFAIFYLGFYLSRTFFGFSIKNCYLLFFFYPFHFHRIHLSVIMHLFSILAKTIWDVLSNKEVIDIIESAPACSSAGRTLVQTTVRAWRYKYPTSKVDDYAVVIIRFSVATHEL